MAHLDGLVKMVIEVAKWLQLGGVNIHDVAEDDYAFRWSCRKWSYIEVAKWLLR